jgi:amidohydrolase
MIANGALDGVSAIFGLHVDPQVAVGRIGLRDGPTMASVTDFDLIIRGVSGHAARPHLSVDAIVTAAEIIESIQKIVSRDLDPADPVVITFGQIHGGVARNVIAGEVVLHGTARTLSRKAARNVTSLIKRVATGVARARGAKVDMTLIADYPVLSNDPRVNRVLARNFEILNGRGKIEVTEPGLGGEDFACYLEKVPGAMFRLGTMNKKIKADKPWHSSRFIVDENAILIGTALLAASVIDTLEGGLR